MSAVSITRASGYELVTAAATALSAVHALAAPDSQSQVLAAALATTVWLDCYYIGVTVGGIAILVGAAVTDRALRGDVRRLSLGLWIERAGLWPSGLLMAAYAAAVFTDGYRGALAGSITLAVGIAHLHRGHQVSRHLRDLSQLGGGERPG